MRTALWWLRRDLRLTDNQALSATLARLLLRIPQVRHLGPLLVRSIVARGEGLMNSAWHDPSKITSEIMAGYKKPTQAENWDRALGVFSGQLSPGA